MSNFAELQKFLTNKHNTLQKNKNYKKTLINDISFLISEKYFLSLKDNIDLSREFLFLSLYYGLIGDFLTLEKIGELNSKKLTRERVRQIIDNGVESLKNFDMPNEIIQNFDNPYFKAKIEINNLFNKFKSNYIRFDDLILLEYFSGFKNNPKGLISFLNDCEIKQITYRGHFFFYDKKENREELIKKIQSDNKNIRKNKTIENMSLKAKTVTYIPIVVKKYLLKESKNLNISLNNLYEKIFDKFIINHPYEDLAFVFPKTKTNQSKKKHDWEQIGIYIDIKIYDRLQFIINKLKKNKREVSSMAFMAQALIWYYNIEDKSFN